MSLSGPWAGGLAVAGRPRGGDWLEDDIRALRDAGVDVLMSMLTDDEIEELELGGEERAAREAGIEYVSFPFMDRSIPPVMDEALHLVSQIESALKDGKGVALHCRHAVGRSVIMAAATLVASGVPVSGAFEQIEKVRGMRVADTEEQREWVVQFARQRALAAQQGAAAGG